jgi:putative Mg2+ transporter-C (MgtC) family protein
MIESFFLNPSTVALAQLVLSMFLGVLLGIERNLAGKTAGMRTYALVSMGATLFILVSNIVIEQSARPSSFDPLRMASAIVTGIGFLGAGIIIFKNTALQGLTTAAGLWIASGIGVAVGFELYAIAIFSTFLTLFIFSVLWLIEEEITERISRQKHDSVTLSENE